jgi:hypothetical protein
VLLPVSFPHLCHHLLQAFSLAATYVALLLFGALSSGGAAAVEAGFSDEGLESPSSDDSRASREKERGGYQTSGLESKYV